MGIFSAAKPETLMDLLHHNLNDLYDAEHRILEALAKLIEESSNEELCNALEKHRTETEGHVSRIEQAFKAMGHESDGPKRQPCDGIKGVLEEGEKTVKMAKDDDALRDVAIVEGCQKVEHYEIAAYGTAKAIALELGETEVADLMDQTLKEEFKADELLTDIAMKDVNPAAK